MLAAWDDMNQTALSSAVHSMEDRDTAPGSGMSRSWGRRSSSLRSISITSWSVSQHGSRRLSLSESQSPVVLVVEGGVRAYLHVGMAYVPRLYSSIAYFNAKLATTSLPYRFTLNPRLRRRLDSEHHPNPILVTDGRGNAWPFRSGLLLARDPDVTLAQLAAEALGANT